MAAIAVTSRESRARVVREVFENYTSAALTVGTIKYEWIVPYRCKILDVIVQSATASVGGISSNIIDIMVNGVTIYTTAANRPTLAALDTGMWTEAGEPDGQTTLNPGDILRFDVIQVDTTGPARTEVIVLVGVR